MEFAMKILKPIVVLAFVVPLLPSLTFAQYTDLVSNQPGVAPNTDAHLVNAWGLVQRPNGPFWVSDNGTGFSTLYTGTGLQINLVVSIPPAAGSRYGTRSPAAPAKPPNSMLLREFCAHFSAG
jgi:hypothetical protein